MPEIASGTEHATFINTFRCEPSNQDEIVRINIDIIDHVASTYPGYISATVHRSIDGTRGLNEFEPHECEVVHVGERG
jgi:hypothetical protein